MKKIFISLLLLNFTLFALELVIGEKRIEPGVMFIFEGAIKDHVMPMGMHLDENQTHVHIEARVNWDEKNIPDGTPAGGFVPYLNITAIVTNQKTGLQTFVDLVPHINLIDNFHYQLVEVDHQHHEYSYIHFFLHYQVQYSLKQILLEIES